MNWGGLKKKIRASRETNSSPPSFKKRFAPMVLGPFRPQKDYWADAPPTSGAGARHEEGSRTSLYIIAKVILMSR